MSVCDLAGTIYTVEIMIGYPRFTICETRSHCTPNSRLHQLTTGTWGQASQMGENANDKFSRLMCTYPCFSSFSYIDLGASARCIKNFIPFNFMSHSS